MKSSHNFENRKIINADDEDDDDDNDDDDNDDDDDDDDVNEITPFCASVQLIYLGIK